jgi:hypothetical protein
MAYLSSQSEAVVRELAWDKPEGDAHKQLPAGTLNHASASENEIMHNTNLIDNYSTHLGARHLRFWPLANVVGA